MMLNNCVCLLTLSCSLSPWWACLVSDLLPRSSSQTCASISPGAVLTVCSFSTSGCSFFCFSGHCWLLKHVSCSCFSLDFMDAGEYFVSQLLFSMSFSAFHDRLLLTSWTFFIPPLTWDAASSSFPIRIFLLLFQVSSPYCLSIISHLYFCDLNLTLLHLWSTLRAHFKDVFQWFVIPLL